MRFRKLRIAWSVTWGIVAVLLCVLWVRSYWKFDAAHGGIGSQFIAVNVVRGVASFAWKVDGPLTPRWKVIHSPLNTAVAQAGNQDNKHFNHGLILGWWFNNRIWRISVSLGLLAVVSGVTGIAPWLTFRFSLRTLLIAMTLIAVVLGLIVWAARK